MLIPGFATEEGTARFKARFEAQLPRHFRKANGLWVSSIGLGTFLGEPTAAHDSLYNESVTCGAERGINVFDSAINYRHQRSERVIAHALTALIAAGHLRRDEVILATKGGFLTFDADEPPDPAAYFRERLIDTGLVLPEDVAAGCHVMSPKFLENQVEQSRRNLGVETLDIYYLHNPETQLTAISHDEFYGRLRAAFEALEKSAAANKIRVYGTATWNAYRQNPTDGEAISLAEVLRIAEEVGGKDHHFRALQLPFNLAMPEALVARSQVWRHNRVSVLELSRAYGLMVFASASLMQAHLVQGLPAQIRDKFPGLHTDAQCAIQFVRSTPGITCALVGMGRREHVEENLATARIAPFTTEEYVAAFAKSG